MKLTFTIIILALYFLFKSTQPLFGQAIDPLFSNAKVQLSAQAKVSFTFQKNSSITISGSSNVTLFKLFLKGEKLPDETLLLTVNPLQDKILISDNALNVAVKDFTSGNKLALRDFHKLVKAGIYPTIRFQLNYIEIGPKKEEVKAWVNITIAGASRDYSIPVSAVRNGDFYILCGNKSLTIRDFGLTPPVEMMGLIKVSEWIDIEFHLICKIALFQIST